MFLYLHSEPAHRLVRKFCEEQGEAFSVGQRALLKQLAEEAFLPAGNRTQSLSPLTESRNACLHLQIQSAADLQRYHVKIMCNIRQKRQVVGSQKQNRSPKALQTLAYRR